MQAGKLWIEFYSNPAEWDISKSCSTVPVTQLYSKYEDLSN